MKKENKSTSRKLSPFMQGKEAQWAGKAEEESPFKDGSDDDAEWLEGYREAQRIEGGSEE